MAENKYIVLPGEQGNIEIAADVVAEIAGIAALETEGVSTIAGAITKENIGRQSAKNIFKGIRIDMAEGAASIDIALNLEYGKSIPEVVPVVQERVKSTVSNMTGLDVAEVNVKVVGVEEEKETNDQKED